MVEKVKSCDEVLIITRGQKLGPLDLQTLREKVWKNNVQLSDLVSLDGGDNWQRIFELRQLGFHCHSSKDLPQMPIWKVFRNSNKDLHEALISKEDSSASGTNAIADLAHLENLRSSGQAPAALSTNRVNGRESMINSERTSWRINLSRAYFLEKKRKAKIYTAIGTVAAACILVVVLLQQDILTNFSAKPSVGANKRRNSRPQKYAPPPVLNKSRRSPAGRGRAFGDRRDNSSSVRASKVGGILPFVPKKRWESKIGEESPVREEHDEDFQYWVDDPPDLEPIARDIEVLDPRDQMRTPSKRKFRTLSSQGDKKGHLSVGETDDLSDEEGEFDPDGFDSYLEF